jgi:hypothetical protein
MSDAGKFYSREPQEITIAAGKKHPFQLNCDWFVIDRCQVGTEAGDDVTLYAAINDRRAAPIRRGEPGAAVNLGRGEIRTIEIENRTASPAFVRVIYGFGSRPYSPETIISNPSLALDADTIDDLATAIAAKQAVPVKGVPYLSVVAAGETKTFDDFAGISILNTGDGNIEILGVEFATGGGMDWNANGRFDTLGPLVVKGLTDGQALVSRVGGTVS